MGNEQRSRFLSEADLKRMRVGPIVDWSQGRPVIIADVTRPSVYEVDEFQDDLSSYPGPALYVGAVVSFSSDSGAYREYRVEKIDGSTVLFVATGPAVRPERPPGCNLWDATARKWREVNEGTQEER